MHRRFRLPIVWLLLAATLMLRAAVPAGWMPAASQDGFQIAICTGDGTEFAVLSRDGTLHKEAPKPAAPGEDCPFALANSMAANAAPASHMWQPEASLAPLHRPAPARIALAPNIDQRPPATGPPALA